MGDNYSHIALKISRIMNSAKIDGMISNIALYVRKIRDVAERSSAYLVIVQLFFAQCRRYR